MAGKFKKYDGLTIKSLATSGLIDLGSTGRSSQAREAFGKIAPKPRSG
jgi:hypothetical protein